MIENLKDEIWAVHPLYNDYAASNLGRIKHTTKKKVEKLNKLTPNDKGYLVFNLYQDGKQVGTPYVHRFVYECFHQCIIPDNLEVNHKSEKRDENFIENLELLSHKDNVNYGSHNERVSKSLTNNSKISKQVGQYALSGELIKIWKSTQEAGRNGFNYKNISACCRGERKTHHNFIWKYIESES